MSEDGSGLEASNNRKDGGSLDDSHHTHEEERERQARETMKTIRETGGDLGARVRQALDHAASLWEETHPGTPEIRHVTPEDDLYARTLARRWIDRDFLVDPDLAASMTVLSVERAAVWRVELRERGESRSIAEGREPYTGQKAPGPSPALPVWDYDLPFAPEIEAGERRERVADSETVAACTVCNATGHVPCSACEGKGFVICPICHGRSRLPCRRCRGRARIPDPALARKAGAAKSYMQVHAERLATEAGERLADFSERLRQDYGVPLPPSARWAPGASAADTDTIPCPDCVNGTVACECGNGKRICETCHGTSAAPCAACSGTGRVIRYRQIVRRFDTHLAHRTLPIGDKVVASWVRPEMMRRASGEDVWQSEGDNLSETPPPDVPADVWRAVLDFAAHTHTRTHATDSERHLIGRRVRVTRIPIARVEYGFAEKPFAFISIGRRGDERFWADAFPPRWSRVGRFFKALSRDLQRDARVGKGDTTDANSGVRSLEDYRQRRALNASEPRDDPASES